jgi:hypothetical protein
VLLVILALIAGGVGWHFLSSDDVKKPEPFVKIGSGVWRAQGDPDRMKAAPIKVNGLPYPSRLKSIITPVEITPSGALGTKDGKPTRATLRFKLNRKVDPAKDFVRVVTSETDTDSWQYITPTISPDGWYAEVTTRHLSKWDVLWSTSKDIALDFAKGLYHGLTGTNENPQKPKCGNAPGKGDLSGYAANYTDKNTAYVCLNKEDGGAALYMVNRKSYPLSIWRTDNIKVTDKGETNAKWGNLFSSAPGKNKFILWPGDKARFSFTFKPGDSGRVNTEFSGYAQSLYRLDVGLSSLFTIYSRFGIKTPALHSNKYYRFMKGMLAVRDCANAIYFQKGAGQIYAACFPELAAGDPFGKIGTEIVLTIVKFCTSLGAYMNSEFRSLVDSFKHDDQFSVLVGRIKVNPFNTVKGTWRIGGTNVSTLDIKSSGSATITVPAGPCNPNDLNSPLCNSITNITFKSSNDGEFTGTYGKTIYRTFEDMTWPATAYMPTLYKAGRTFKLWLNQADVIKMDSAGPGKGLGCRKDSTASSTVCGQ